MKVSCTCLFVLILTELLIAASPGQEKKINRADLPAAVEKTVVSQRHGAAIRGFSQETENGRKYYEAEMVVNGHSKDVLIDTNGAVVEVEEEVTLDSLPSAVRDGLQIRAGKGKVVKVESITKHDKLVAYESPSYDGPEEI